MSELRWHPFLRQWVDVAANRQNRPQMPRDWCPFCPGSGRVPDDYDVLIYPNDFPAFSPDYAPFDPTPGLYRTTGAQGACDVVLYSPQHTLLPSQMPPEQWEKVVGLWSRRYQELARRPEVRYVSIFENSGEAIGVTMPHPHGQIYAFPFVPPQSEKLLSSGQEYHQQSGRCLHCAVIEHERQEGIRVVTEDEHFVSFVPFYGRFPTEVHLYPKRHVARLPDLTPEESTALAHAIRATRRKYDGLYNFMLPLMMAVQNPEAHGQDAGFHFHIQFLPIQRSATKLKYMATVEAALGTFLNDTRPEEQAERLRAVAV